MLKKSGKIKLCTHKETQFSETVIQSAPKKITLPMAMSAGDEAKALVNIGDKILMGQKIAQSSGTLSLPIHSSVSGKVVGFGQMRLINGKTCKTVQIESDGEQTLFCDIKPVEITDKESLITALKESGICGLGGAGFPTYVKLSAKADIDTLIINAAECEPYITSDCREIIENTDDVVNGIKLIKNTLGIHIAIIAIEENNFDALNALSAKLENCDDISVFTLKGGYPQGAEKVLIRTVTKRTVKPDCLPSDVGVIVLNVSTVSQINRYCKTGVPLIKRRVTVQGDCVSKPCNVLAYIGTEAKELFELAETDFSKLNRVVFGGPMTGNPQISLNSPITKTTNAILALSKSEYKRKTACIRCARCVNACPAKLMPTEIEKAYIARDIERLKKLNVSLCMGCASCSFVCPANRNLAETVRLAKSL